MRSLLAWIAMVGVLVSAQSGTGKAELDATVHVRVVTLGTGEPLEGVWVWAGRKPFDGTSSEFMFGLAGGESTASRAYQSMDGVGALVQTPASGAVDLRVTSGPGLWIAAMGSSGDQARLDPLTSGARAQLDFELRSGRTRYQGWVRERVSGAPVVGARVEGVDFDFLAGAQTTTDADGRFELETGGSFPSVRITAPGFGPSFGALTFGHADAADPLVFWLDRAAKLSVRVLELDGRPVVGTPLRLKADRHHLLQPDPPPDDLRGLRENCERWSGTTDADGRCELDGLPARAWLALELVDQRPPWSEFVVLAPGEERELVLVPNARVGVRGVALDGDGRPVAGLTLCARRLAPEGSAGLDASVPTAADGAFRLQGLRTGTWFVGTSSNAEELGLELREQRVELTNDVREPELVLHLVRGLFLRGRLSTTDGSVPGGARVEARSSDGNLVREGHGDEDGRFSIGPLPEGEYALRASRQGRFTRGPVRALAGASELVVPVPRLGGLLFASARNGHGAIETALVLAPERPDLARSARFALGSCVGERVLLESGLYDVVLRTDDRRLGRIVGLEPSPEGSYGKIELAPCATLRFVFTGPELFARVIARQGDAVYASVSATQGAACGLFVPPGKIRLEVFPLSAWEPSGAPLLRELTAELGREPEVLVP